MLNSKKSPRKSNLFRSRFMAAGRDAATIRDVRRLREYLASEIITAVLQFGFLVALFYFARAVNLLFERHGDALNPWYLRLALGAVAVCFLLVGRRLFNRLREIFAVRSDLAEANRRLEELREDLRKGQDD